MCHITGGLLYDCSWKEGLAMSCSVGDLWLHNPDLLVAAKGKLPPVSLLGCLRLGFQAIMYPRHFRYSDQSKYV